MPLLRKPSWGRRSSLPSVSAKDAKKNGDEATAADQAELPHPTERQNQNSSDVAPKKKGKKSADAVTDSDLAKLPHSTERQNQSRGDVAPKKKGRLFSLGSFGRKRSWSRRDTKGSRADGAQQQTSGQQQASAARPRAAPPAEETLTPAELQMPVPAAVLDERIPGGQVELARPFSSTPDEHQMQPDLSEKLVEPAAQINSAPEEHEVQPVLAQIRVPEALTSPRAESTGQATALHLHMDEVSTELSTPQNSNRHTLTSPSRARSVNSEPGGTVVPIPWDGRALDDAAFTSKGTPTMSPMLGSPMLGSPSTSSTLPMESPPPQPLTSPAMASPVAGFFAAATESDEAAAPTTEPETQVEYVAAAGRSAGHPSEEPHLDAPMAVVTEGSEDPAAVPSALEGVAAAPVPSLGDAVAADGATEPSAAQSSAILNDATKPDIAEAAAATATTAVSVAPDSIESPEAPAAAEELQADIPASKSMPPDAPSSPPTEIVTQLPAGEDAADADGEVPQSVEQAPVVEAPEESNFEQPHGVVADAPSPKLDDALTAPAAAAAGLDKGTGGLFTDADQAASGAGGVSLPTATSVPTASADSMGVDGSGPSARDVPATTEAPSPVAGSVAATLSRYQNRTANQANSTPARHANYVDKEFDSYNIRASKSKYSNKGDCRLVAHGAGGIDELRGHLDNNFVMYGLLQAVIGSGFLARRKYVLLHFKGESCPAMWKMRHGARKQEVAGRLGGGTVEFTCERQTDATVDALLEQLLRHCVADDGDENTTIASLRADLEKQVAAAQNALKEERARRHHNASPPKRTAVALRSNIRLQEVIRLCQKPTGPINWLLVTPEARLLEAGGGSIDEMRTFLSDDAVLFGMLRMAFGAGRFRRCHWLFFHWAGPACPGVKLGRANVHKASAKEVLQPTSIDYFANALDEFTVKIIIDKVRRYAVVEDDEDETQNVFSIEAFMEAVKEDKAELAKEFGVQDEEEAGAEDGGLPQVSLEEAVRLVRDKDSPFNWVLAAPC